MTPRKQIVVAHARADLDAQRGQSEYVTNVRFTA
jgi:hypothetical protein